MRREREERAHFKTSKNAALFLLHEHVFLITILSNVLRLSQKYILVWVLLLFFIFTILFFIQLLVTLPFLRHPACL